RPDRGRTPAAAARVGPPGAGGAQSFSARLAGPPCPPTRLGPCPDRAGSRSDLARRGMGRLLDVPPAVRETRPRVGAETGPPRRRPCRPGYSGTGPGIPGKIGEPDERRAGRIKTAIQPPPHTLGARA